MAQHLRVGSKCAACGWLRLGDAVSDRVGSRERSGAMFPLLLLTIMGMVGGCKTHLMPTPNIYASGDYTLFVDLPPELQTTTVDLLYVTDRKPAWTEDGELRYTHDRSASLAFGSALVEIGQDMTWEALLAASTEPRREGNLDLNVRRITEVGRLAPTPIPMTRNEAGELVDDPAVLAHQQGLAEQFRAEVRRRLETSRGQEVYLYIHGFNNTFDYAASILAEFWHFGGRAGVPILYTWPAGARGLVRGYTHDRESCEFTIYHLKQTIKVLASMPEVQKINVIAHSRGTDVAASALRELLIEERGAGQKASESLRIGEVILASPDVDYDVARQRYGAERFFDVCEHLTIYVSTKDTALGFAEWLLQSSPRLGRLRPEDLPESQRKDLTLVGKTDFVDVRVSGGAMGHSYYHSSPAASSDLILTLRYHAKPGSAERPLREVAPSYYVLDDEAYPRSTAKSEE